MLLERAFVQTVIELSRNNVEEMRLRPRLPKVHASRKWS